MPTVEVPGVGQVERKYVIAGGGIALGIAAWYWIRRKNAAAASTVDPTIDPQTGLPYATPQAETNYQNPNPVQSVISGTGAITTNAQWTADVIDKLGNIGLDPSYVGQVIGKYLSSQALSLDEAAVVRTAWAFSGKPPQGPENFTLTTNGGAPGSWPSSDWYYTASANDKTWLDVAKVGWPHNPELWTAKAAKLQTDNANQTDATGQPHPGQVIHMGTGADRDKALAGTAT